MRVEGLRLVLLILTRINANLRHCEGEESGVEGAVTEFVGLFREALRKASYLLAVVELL